MKNLTYHKTQIKERIKAKKLAEAFNNAVDKAAQPILAASADRWNELENQLRLQRCKLNESIATHPYRMQDKITTLIKATRILSYANY